MSKANGREWNTDGRIFGTTKGRLLILLCGGKRTVAELAASLDITTNAVRAQLERLGRDGLVRQAGSRRGVRKPHADYEITLKARRLFPTAYELVLREFLNRFDKHAPQKVALNLLADVLRHLLKEKVGTLSGRDPRQRLSELMNRLKTVAPGVALEKQGNATSIHACSCPLASVTASHPELCQIVAGSLAEILRIPVAEKCERGEWPQCCFEVDLRANGRGKH
jgi:predicted ArsR family transcriptional regulator